MGLEKIVEQRINKTGMGFGSATRERKQLNTGELLAQLETEDLMRFGMIPEFIGRLPVVATLEDLDEAALIDILTRPKNALVKQYQKLFDMEGVQLRFTDTALSAVAKEAVKRKTGARGLRAIVEELMLDVMYDLPGKTGVRECVVTDEVVARKKDPILVYENEAV